MTVIAAIWMSTPGSDQRRPHRAVDPKGEAGTQHEGSRRRALNPINHTSEPVARRHCQSDQGLKARLGPHDDPIALPWKALTLESCEQ